MKYPKFPNLNPLVQQLELHGQIKTEYGAKDVGRIYAEAERAMKAALAKLKKLPIDKELARKEPNGLEEIRALRPKGPRRLFTSIDEKVLREKMEGALVGRMAGCILGASVEFTSIEWMETWSKWIGDTFPPVDYFTQLNKPYYMHYNHSLRETYTRGKMDGVPVDDDIMYTVLGLLIAEEFGPDFTVEDAGKAWVKHLPHGCTAEAIALKNLRAGVPAGQAIGKDNPYTEWIGANIRADPWGYIAAGWPERAAEMARREAYVSHRRNGVYGSMFFAAAIAAAFAVGDPIEAIHIGLTEIPKDCFLAKEIRWALRAGKNVKNYRQAREAVDARFAGMHRVHTINNACLTVFGLMLGGTDYTKVISQTVAMGMDNDCNAATAGSIVGAIIGFQNIPKHWHKPFNNTVHSYLIGKKKFKIDSLVKRFLKQAKIVRQRGAGTASPL